MNQTLFNISRLMNARLLEMFSISGDHFSVI